MIYQKYTGEIELKNIGRKNLLLSKDEVINKQQEEIERLHSIIKEVREYINNNIDYQYIDLTIDSVVEDINEILDKAGDK